MPNELFTGVVEADPRIDPRVINGYSIDEILPQSAPFDWVVKGISEVVQYPTWNQGASSSCVAFSKAKQVSIRIFKMTGVWIDFSPASIYQLRANKPALGMSIPDANDIVNRVGVTLEALMKSQNLTEEQINTVKRSKVGDLFAKAIAEAVVRYLYVPVDIDRIAQTIQAEKVVSLLIFATYDEYARMTPIIIDPNLTYANAPVRHEVVGVDYFLGQQNAMKRIYVNDSAHFGGLAVREFTEEFLEKRCILADAIDVFSFDPQDDKPHYTFNKDLVLGITDPDVIALQDCLKYEGLFPTDQPSTGYYGNLTAGSVFNFQNRYGITPPNRNRVGPQTRAKLNERYGA